jgi:PAS domain S-box-containing protein
MHANAAQDTVFKRLALTFAIIVFAICMVALLGYVVDWPLLFQFSNSYIPMSILAVVSFLTLSSMLILHFCAFTCSQIKKIECILTLLILIMNGVFLLKISYGNGQIEQWINSDLLAWCSHFVNNHSLLTAVNLMLSCVAFLLILTNERAKKIIAAWVATVVTINATIILLSYLYGAPWIYPSHLVSVALPTALTTLLLNIALVLIIGKNYFPLRAFLGLSIDAQLMRALVPFVILVVFIQGWLDVIIFPVAGAFALTAGIVITLSCIFLAIIISFIGKNISQKVELYEVERQRVTKEMQDISLYNRTLIEASPDPLIITNKLGLISDVNTATELFTGISRDKLMGTDLSQYFTQPDAAKKGYLQVFSAGFIKDYPLSIKNIFGAVRDVSFNALLYKDSDGMVVGVLAIARDVTERNEAAKEAKKYLTELERSNQELQQFAYIASHDLQEPLRMITNYLQLIERRYKGKLDKDADEFIDFAVDGAIRLDVMITDLLHYSRVGTQAKEFELTDVNGIISNVIADLQVQIQEARAIINYENLPSIMADKNQISQLFQNLLSNAIKFRQKDKPPMIDIAAKDQGGEWLFSVSDNGIGMDMQYKDKLFIVFKRLVSKEYPGTGIGLAISKKIVERHKGKIWVESKLGEGSVFYFTIPN